MAFDVGKIIDGLKLSYGQLRNLLITSIGAIATVWIVGNKVGSITSQLNTFNATLIEIKKELISTKLETNIGLNRIYTDFTIINNLNNELWNKKFGLILEYGDNNKELLKKLIKYEDNRNAVKVLEINSKKNYQIQVSPVEPTDKKNNKYQGEILIIPIDKYGKLNGDTISDTYEFKESDLKKVI